jgi:hypothetical protein
VRSAPRFAGVPHRAGHYESYYIKASRPSGGRAIWIRYTVHKAPGADPTAALWLTLFDSEAPEPRAVKASFGAHELSAPAGGYIRIDGAELDPGHAVGEISAAEIAASWDLTFTDEGEPFHHLPYDRLYDAPLPRTKFLSPYPSARFDGRLTIGGEEIALTGWPGMIGHNWGAEHAERWVWIQGAFLDEGEPAYFDMAAGRIKIGPVTTPWVANGMLRIGDTEHRLGGFDRMFRTKVAEQPTSCKFQISGKGIKVRGRAGSERRNFVAWVYADPNGPEHTTLNCSIADLELEVDQDGEPLRRLALAAGAAYEFGSRDTGHGIPLQPYPDG